MRRKRQFVSVLMLAAATAIALVMAASGTAGGRHSAVSGPSGVGTGGPMVGSGGGYGETYSAAKGTLTHALFQATLLPAGKATRNVSLAGYGRALHTAAAIRLESVALRALRETDSPRSRRTRK